MIFLNHMRQSLLLIQAPIFSPISNSFILFQSSPSVTFIANS